MAEALDKLHTWVAQEVVQLKQVFSWMRWDTTTVVSDIQLRTTIEGRIQQGSGFTLTCHFDKQEKGSWKFCGGWTITSSLNPTVYLHAAEAVQQELNRLEKEAHVQKFFGTAYKLHVLRQGMR